MFGVEAVDFDSCFGLILVGVGCYSGVGSWKKVTKEDFDTGI